MASSYLEKSGVAERQKNAVEFELKKFFDKELISIKTEYVKTDCPGSCIVLWLETENCILGSDAIGERNVKAEMLGKNAAQDLIECYQLGATVDKYTADQIIPFLGLTKNSTIKIQKITGHIETALWLSELFLEMKFDIIKNNCVVIKD